MPVRKSTQYLPEPQSHAWFNICWFLMLIITLLIASKLFVTPRSQSHLSQRFHHDNLTATTLPYLASSAMPISASSFTNDFLSPRRFSMAAGCSGTFRIVWWRWSLICGMEGNEEWVWSNYHCRDVSRKFMNKNSAGEHAAIDAQYSSKFQSKLKRSSPSQDFVYVTWSYELLQNFV